MLSRFMSNMQWNGLCNVECMIGVFVNVVAVMAGGAVIAMWVRARW